MTAAINLFNKIFSLMLSLLLMATGGVNTLFNGDIKEYDSVDGVVGLESLVRAQGITTDGESFIYSGKNALERVSLDGGEVLAINTSAIEESFETEYGSKHIGGISCAGGKLYCAIEDSKVWQHPIIAVYDPVTLEFTGEYYELPTELHQRGVPFVIADSENGVAYTMDSRNYTEIFVWSLDNFEYLRTISLANEIKAAQGGEYYNGLIYFGTNDMTRAVYTVNPETGETNKLFDRIMYEYTLIDNFGGEGEDLTILPAEDGTYIHTLQIGATFTDATTRHYS